MASRRVAALAAWGWIAFAETPAPPAIDAGGVLNAASRMPASLGGGAIARGARFTLAGVRLGPAQGVRARQSDPPHTLAGCSVEIAQAEMRVAARLFYASAERIEGWIPPSAPLGAVTLAVTYQSRTSEPYHLTLVRSSFGFFTPETTPEGVPGETATLSGTGAGDAALRVFVGGKAASVVSVGGTTGIQRIQFRIPSEAPHGCAVPVQAVTGEGRASNTVTT